MHIFGFLLLALLAGFVVTTGLPYVAQFFPSAITQNTWIQMLAVGVVTVGLLLGGLLLLKKLGLKVAKSPL